VGGTGIRELQINQKIVQNAIARIGIGIRNWSGRSQPNNTVERLRWLMWVKPNPKLKTPLGVFVFKYRLVEPDALNREDDTFLELKKRDKLNAIE